MSLLLLLVGASGDGAPPVTPPVHGGPKRGSAIGRARRRDLGDIIEEERKEDDEWMMWWD